MSRILCSKKNCAISDTKEERLSCSGFCERTFHLTCVGLVEGVSTRSKMGGSKLKEHYICSSCSDTQKGLAVLIENQFMRMLEVTERNNQQMLNSSRASSNQDHVINEVSKQLDQLASDVKNLTKVVKKMEPISGNSGTSIDDAILLDKLDKVSKVLSDVAERQLRLDAQILAGNLNLDEVREKQENLISQNIETNNFMAKIREDMTILLEKGPKPSVLSSHQTESDPLVNTDSEGWTTLASGKRVWRPRGAAPPVVFAKQGSFRYTEFRENQSANKQNNSGRDSTRKRSMRRPRQPTCQPNPSDIDELDVIIEQERRNSLSSNFVRGPGTNSMKPPTERSTNYNNNFVRGSTFRGNGVKFNLDPLKPPIVQLTERSNREGGRYTLSRLRDDKILSAIRLYLSYLYDKKPDVCINGNTCTSIKVFLASEGLPTELNSLQKLYHDFHRELGLSVSEVNKDLTAYGSEIKWNRIHLMEQRNGQHKKHYAPHSSDLSFFE